MQTLVLTAIGDDRPGLVSALSAALSEHGASWERSQMARLAGKFAGIVEVSVPTAHADDLLRALEGLRDEGLAVSATRSMGAPPLPSQRLALTVVGADRPGIVAEISAVLSEHGISIEELGTTVAEAPMAGGMLFEARALLAASGETREEALRSALEQVADELMVDFALAEED